MMRDRALGEPRLAKPLDGSARVILPLLLAASLLAFGLSTVSGGGAGLLLVPLLGLMLPVTEVPAALSIGTATSSVSRIAAFRRDIRWDLVRWFVPAALPAAAFGAWLLTRFEPVYVEFILGCFLAANLPFVFRGQRRPAAPQTAKTSALSRFGLLVLGGFAGVISGFTGSVGLLLNRFYLRGGMTKEQIVATRAANEVLLHLLKLVIYAGFGLISVHAIEAGATMAVAAVLVALFMRRLLPLINEGLFAKIAIVSMTAAGIAILGDAGSHILVRHHVTYAANSGEMELNASLAGRRYVVELDRDGSLIVERSTSIAALPAQIQAAVGELARRVEITLVEEVFKTAGKSYEVHFRQRDGQSSEIEYPGGV